MAYRYGRCTNSDYCSVAAARQDVAAPSGEGFVCPECRKPLKTPQRIGGNGRALAATMAGFAILAVAGGAYLLSGRGPATVSLAHVAVDARKAEPAKPATLAGFDQPAAVQAPRPASIVLRLSGSNTVGAVLGPRLARAFLQETGDTGVTIAPAGKPDEVRVTGMRGGREEIIAVSAHGSATAFTDLAAGLADVGMASRRIKPAEAASLASVGDMTASTSEHILALDGIAVVVSPENPLQSLTLSQLRAIFSGAVTDWSQLGAPAGGIHVFARDDKSGTYDTFKALVLGDATLSPGTRRVEDSRELSSAVASDRTAIGFVGLPYILSARAVPVSDTGATPLLPNRLTVGTEDYALSRRLYLYTAAHGANALVARFADFALSPAGQAIAEESGFVPLTIKPEPALVPATAAGRLRALIGNATRLSTNFRFRPNSAALDNRGQRDLDRLVDFVVSSHARASAIILAGFADNRGAPAQNMAVARKRADTVAAGLAQRGLRVSQVLALGSDLPVADNASDAGREKNRRVEVYLHL